MKTAERLVSWPSDRWQGDLSIGHLFLGIAIWDSIVAAINVLVWPRVYGPETLAFMTPTAQWLPVAICLGLATLSPGMGLKPMIKTYATIGLIALATFMLWSPQSEAWLNSFGQSFVR